MHYTAAFRETPPSQPELFQLFEEEPSGGQPAPLSEVAGWQERVQRHVAEQVLHAPVVQILDAPLPQMVDYLLDTLRLLDRPIAEQVIDVPKFSLDSVQQRFVDRDHRLPQMVEHLVEVLTVLSFASLQQRTAAHYVNISVTGGRGSSGSGGGRGLQGFLHGQI